MIKTAINFFMFCILYSCQSNVENKKYNTQTITPMSTQQVTTNDLIQWKEDSLGCKHYRTPALFDKLFMQYKFQYKKKNVFVDFFGKPNKQEQYNGRLVLVYYYNSICSGNKLIENADKSSIRVSFNFDDNYLGKDTRIE